MDSGALNETWSSSRKSRKSSSRVVGLAGDHEVLELKMRGGLARSLRIAHVEEQVWQESMRFGKKMSGGVAESPRRSSDDGNTICSPGSKRTFLRTCMRRKRLLERSLNLSTIIISYGNYQEVRINGQLVEALSFNDLIAKYM
jgi:hypothetical protein